MARAGTAHRLAGVAALLMLAAPACDGYAEPELSRIRLPPGFAISVFAEVPGARSMTYAADLDTLFVGTHGDRVYAVVDDDHDGRAERVTVLGSDFNAPNGVAHDGRYLYVAERDRIVRYLPSRRRLAQPKVLYDKLPDKGGHGLRYAAVGPDRRLYVAVGTPCNICQGTGIEGTIVRMGLDGSGFEVFARGIRNSVGIDFNPRTGVLFFTDNGADGMGDNSPPDEINSAPTAGLDFGYPYYGGGHDVTPQYRGRPAPPDVRFPVVDLPAHVAALGIHFYRGTMFPPGYRTDAFVAEHGSWNRTVPDGYRVARVRFDAEGRPHGTEVFASGWLQEDGRAWGRPVDVKELPDGSLLVSDDRAGLIYRITYKGS